MWELFDSTEFGQRKSELAQNFQQKWRTYFLAAVKWDCTEAAIRMNPLLVTS